MIKKLFFVSLMICFSSCGSKKSNNTGTSKADYVMAYKKAVLYGCINGATNGNLAKFSQENYDIALAGVVAVLNHSEAEKAQELGAELSKNIRLVNYMDQEGRKPVFDDCIDFAFSTKIDSLAQIEYDNFRRNEGKLHYEHD